MKLILISDLLNTPFDHPELWVSSDLKSVQLPFAALGALLKSEYTLVNGDHNNGGIYHSQDVRVDSDNAVVDWLGDDNTPLLSISLFSEHGDVMFDLGDQFQVDIVFQDSPMEQKEHLETMKKEAVKVAVELATEYRGAPVEPNPEDLIFSGFKIAFLIGCASAHTMIFGGKVAGLYEKLGLSIR